MGYSCFIFASQRFGVDFWRPFQCLVCVAGETFHPQSSLSTALHFFFFFWNVKELLISSLHKKHEVQPWKLVYWGCYYVLVFDLLLLNLHSISVWRKAGVSRRPPRLSSVGSETSGIGTADHS